VTEYLGGQTPKQLQKIWRWGIIATGKISQDFCRVLKTLKNAEIVAIGSRSQESADKFGDEWGVKNRHPSYDKLAEDPEVDIVYVGTLHNLHHDNMLACLRNGKHVLCEKAFTLNAQQAKEVIDLAREKKVFLMEAMWVRYNPAFTQIRKLLDEKAIGEIQFVQASFGFEGNLEKTPRLIQLDMAGGSLLDVGIYPLALASLCFGGKAPTEILATADRKDGEGDRRCYVTLKYGDKKGAQLTSGIDIDFINEALIMGTKGFIHIPGHMWHISETFTLKLKGEKDKVFKCPRRKIEGKFNFEGNESLVHEAEEVMACLEAGRLESPIMPLDESLTIMKTMDAIRKQIGLVYPDEK